MKVKEYIRFVNKYFKENIKKLFIILGIVFILVSVGTFLVVKFLPPEKLGEIYMSILEIFDSKDVTNNDGSLSFLGILINNVKACFLTCMGGFIPFVFMPVISMALNGGIMGAVLGVTEVLTHESAFIAFGKYILPHGIFELPAIVLSTACGTKICMLLCRKIFGGAKDESMKFHIKGCSGVFVLYILPLLVVAAFIEAVVLSAIYM